MTYNLNALGLMVPEDVVRGDYPKSRIVEHPTNTCAKTVKLLWNGRPARLRHRGGQSAIDQTVVEWASRPFARSKLKAQQVNRKSLHPKSTSPKVKNPVSLVFMRPGLKQ